MCKLSLSLLAAAILISLLVAMDTTRFYTPSQAPAFFSIAYSTVYNINNFLTYYDPILGIRIEYPASWIHELHPGSLVTFLASSEGSSNTYPAGLGLKVQNLAYKNISLNEITKVQIKNLTENHPDFKLIESSESILAGNIAHKIVFNATDNKGNERTSMQIWTLIDSKAYIITYKAEPENYTKYLPIIIKMIDSFHIVK
jgi:hypothetical protein